MEWPRPTNVSEVREFHWIGGILPPVHWGLCENCQAHDGAPEKGCPVRMDRGSREKLSRAESQTNLGPALVRPTFTGTSSYTVTRLGKGWVASSCGTTRQDRKADGEIRKAIQRIGTGPVTGLRVDEKGTLWFKNRICVPKTGVTRKIVMEEAHNSAYSIHPGSTKMYLDLKTDYGWKGMKADIARYVARCDVCRE
ncbi:hypothetical protein U9M48_044702 [Paspalum notatum var. saurae]|uniref:Integrase zinc-binding domain-containing protein n=1 Tax=Paspalum notatum var. saurae TaxID=547442 RepID=A0AAQ3XII8_PASNO